jgi:hypothetical protein
MTNFEMVEKLREKANVSYEEAKEALERNNWDLLDAMVYLEQQGKVNHKGEAEYSTRQERSDAEESKEKRSKKNHNENLNSFFQKVQDVVVRGFQRSFNISYKENTVLTIPLTILVIILLLVFKAIPFLLVVALISYLCGVRFSISNKSNKQDQAAAARAKEAQVSRDETINSNHEL